MTRSSSEELRVLVLPPTTADGLAIQKLLAAGKIECRILRSVTEVCLAIREGAGVVVISEEALLDDAEPLLACIGSQAVWSDLPVIV
ncbi:MAG TPA: hybrid sensor histidine kinase/response regulator, partial [Gammaproteobacteria bacterium]|nr:hybrid sensor histidine kinase/response regulator [Gammaproteobacteria bacterium]